MIDKHQKELTTNEKLDKIKKKQGYEVLQKSFGFSTRPMPDKKPFFVHVSVCHGFDRQYGHEIEGLELAEIKSSINNVSQAIDSIRKTLKKYPWYPKYFKIRIYAWKGGKPRKHKTRLDEKVLERQYFQVYRYENDFAYDEKDRLYYDDGKEHHADGGAE